MTTIPSATPKTIRSYAVRPFPKPSVLYRQRQKELVEATKPTEDDVGFSAAPNDEEPAGHHHVERYLCFSVSEEMRQRLEDYLGDHPEVDEEAGCAMLLEMGLDQVAKEAGAERDTAAQKAEETVRLAERLYRRAKSPSQ